MGASCVGPGSPVLPSPPLGQMTSSEIGHQPAISSRPPTPERVPSPQTRRASQTGKRLMAWS